MMPRSTNPNVFEPPTAEQLARHLASNMPVHVGAWQSRLPLIAVVAGVGLVLVLAGSPGFALLPLFLLMGLMVYMSGRSRTELELQARATRVWELAMIRRYREALGQAWDMVPACRTRPELHGRIVTVIAHILAELKQDEAADVAYGYLLDRLPGEHPMAVRLRVQRAVAALMAGRLADGDDALRKLRGLAESADDPSLAASYRMARLVQDVQTGHYADVITEADQTAEALTPLGIEAGYGHGLMAFCFDQLAQRDSAEEDAAEREQLNQQAGRWWDRATMLIPTSALLFRHPDLRQMPGRVDLASDLSQPTEP